MGAIISTCVLCILAAVNIQETLHSGYYGNLVTMMDLVAMVTGYYVARLSEVAMITNFTVAAVFRIGLKKAEL